MNSLGRNIGEKRSLMLFVIAAMAFEGLLVGQGFSMYDETYFMSAYQWIFCDPSVCQYQFLYYNGVLLGGVWEMLFGQYGYIAFRIGGALVNILTCLTIYWVLRPHARRGLCLLAMTMYLISFSSGVMVIYPSFLTALLTTLAVGCMDRAMMRDSGKWALMAGVIIGVNIFTRLPNVALCGLLLAFIPYYYKGGRGRLLPLWALGGLAAGIVAEMLLMMALGHLGLFADNLTVGMAIADSSDNTHGIAQLMSEYLTQYLMIVKRVLLLLVLPVAWFREPVIITLYTLFTIVLLVALYKERNNAQRVCIISLALLQAYLQPLGSDFGIANMGDCSDLIALPLAIVILYEGQRSKVKGRRSKVALYLLLSLVSYCLVMIHTIASRCDFDEGPRWEKTYRIDNPLATTYTSKEHAEIINTLLVALKPYVQKGDYLMAYYSLPGINYLTETRPWVPSAWLLSYDAASLEREIEKAEKTKPLPVVVIEKGSPTCYYRPYKDWDNDKAENPVTFHVNKKITLRHDFLKRHRYEVVWENDLFQIQKPQ